MVLEVLHLGRLVIGLCLFALSLLYVLPNDGHHSLNPLLFLAQSTKVQKGDGCSSQASLAISSKPQGYFPNRSL